MEDILKKNIVMFSLGLMFSGLVGGLTLLNFIGFELTGKWESERVKEEKEELKAENQKLKDMLVDHRIAMASWGKIRTNDIHEPFKNLNKQTSEENRTMMDIFKDYWLLIFSLLIIAGFLSALVK